MDDLAARLLAHQTSRASRWLWMTLLLEFPIRSVVRGSRLPVKFSLLPPSAAVYPITRASSPHSLAQGVGGFAQGANPCTASHASLVPGVGMRHDGIFLPVAGYAALGNLHCASPSSETTVDSGATVRSFSAADFLGSSSLCYQATRVLQTLQNHRESERRQMWSTTSSHHKVSDGSLLIRLIKKWQASATLYFGGNEQLLEEFEVQLRIPVSRPMKQSGVRCRRLKTKDLPRWTPFCSI